MRMTPKHVIKIIYIPSTDINFICLLIIFTFSHIYRYHAMINYIAQAYIFVHTILIAVNKKLYIVRRLSKLF